MAIDEQKMEEAVGKVFGELAVAVTGPLVVLGDRLGLWAALAEAGPMTPNELASRTGTVERYVREWLRGVAVAGYVGYDPATGAFTLSDEMAPVLATDDSPASLIGVFEGFVGMWNDLATIEGFFRTGGGMSWGDHHPALNDAQARFTRPMYRAALVDGWIAALDGVTARLQAGGQVADIGCGQGTSTITMAERFPASSFTGFDHSDAVIAAARKAADDAGLADRVSFEVADAASFPAGPGQGYDLVLLHRFPARPRRPGGRRRARPRGPGARRDRDGRRAARRRPVRGRFHQPVRPCRLRHLDDGVHALLARPARRRRARGHGGRDQDPPGAGRRRLHPGAPGGRRGRAVQHRAGGPVMSGTMYLGAAYFDGDPGELLPAYQRMLEKFGLDALDVHLCITTDAGLTVFDACPTRETYEEFTRSETFLGAIAEAGLPAPRVSGLGDIQVAHVRQTVRP